MHKAEQSLKLWKSGKDCSEGKLPTVSAIIAAVAEENLRSFLSCDRDEGKLEEIVQFWLEHLKQMQKKQRRLRKELVSIEAKDLPSAKSQAKFSHKPP